MDIDCIEIERRLAIGFNDHLSLAARHRLVCSGRQVDEISYTDHRFKPYIRETRDILHWLSRSPAHTIIWYGDMEFPSFNPLRAHLPYMLLCDGHRPDISCVAKECLHAFHASAAGI